MKHLRTAAVACFALGSVSSVGADYTECAKFLNNGETADGHTAYKVKESGPFIAPRYRLVPFKFRENGRVKIYKRSHGKPIIHEVTRAAGDDSKIEHIEITYPLAPLEKLEDMEVVGDVSGWRQAKVLLYMDSEGDLARVVESMDLDKAEISRLRDSERKTDYIAHSATTTLFEIKSGKCVPMRMTETLISNADPEGNVTERAESVTFDTKMCSDIKKLFRRHPEAEAAFDGFLNSRVASVFAINGRSDPEQDGVVAYPGNDVMDDFGASLLHETNPLQSFRIQVSMGLYLGAAYVDEDEQRAYGMSPVLLGHMILANCYAQGLGPFLDDDVLWDDDP